MQGQRCRRLAQSTCQPLAQGIRYLIQRCAKRLLRAGTMVGVGWTKHQLNSKMATAYLLGLNVRRVQLSRCLSASRADCEPSGATQPAGAGQCPFVIALVWPGRSRQVERVKKKDQDTQTVCAHLRVRCCSLLPSKGLSRCVSHGHGLETTAWAPF